MFIATLIAASLTPDDLSRGHDAMAATGCEPGTSAWLDEAIAADIGFARDPIAARAALERLIPTCDIVVQPAQGRAKRLLVADMDSTMITVECIDELADYAGIKTEIAAVTDAAMRGDLDFAAALDARVALLRGLPEAVIERCLAERVHPMPGARTLVRTMRAHGATAVLVSGGFTRFAEPVGARIGFDRVVANTLLIEAGALTGAVARPIVDADAKQRVLVEGAAALGLPLSASLAVGDGANDLAMIRRAGLGVAYHAKPIVAAAAGARIDHGDLTALLYAQGHRRADWVD